MATGTVIKATRDGTTARVVVMVNEGGARGRVEYIGTSPLVDADGNTLTVPQIKAACIADIVRQREAAAPSEQTVAISGTVTV